MPDPILAALAAPLRVLVETGYDRTASPGQPTTAHVPHPANSGTVLTNFVAAIPTGIDDGLQEAGRGLPFHTTPAGPFGVGGPPAQQSHRLKDRQPTATAETRSKTTASRHPAAKESRPNTKRAASQASGRVASAISAVPGS